MSTAQASIQDRAASKGAETSRFKLGEFLGWFGVRAALIGICLLWTLPTFGLLISSLRDKDALATTGWWTSLQSTVRLDQARSSTQVQEVDGRYVITGDIFESRAGGRISRFGIRSNSPTEFEVGTTVELGDGLTLILQSDGVYEIASAEPFELDAGRRFFYEVTVPPRLTLDNYREVFTAYDIDTAFVNTATVAIPATIIPITIAAFAAYAFSWMQFPGRQALFVLVVGLLVVPLQMSLIPLVRIYSSLGIVGTYPGVWLAHTGFGLPLAIFLLRNYIAALPREIIESAQIDGATHFQIFTRLVVPLSIPALASFAIFQFLWVWNDLLVALVFLGKRPENTVLTAALAELTGSRGDNWEIMTATAFVSIIVPLIVFFSLQRYFVRGLLAGSVKGG